MGKAAIITCKECGQERRNNGRGLCLACYRKVKDEGRLDEFPRVLGSTQDPQCAYVHANGVRCPNTRHVRKNGRYKNKYCPGHAHRYAIGRDMEPPVRRYVREPNPRCQYVRSDGTRCDGMRNRDRNGYFLGPYCGMCKNRMFHGFDLDAPRGARVNGTVMFREKQY